MFSRSLLNFQAASYLIFVLTLNSLHVYASPSLPRHAYQRCRTLVNLDEYVRDSYHPGTPSVALPLKQLADSTCEICAPLSSNTSEILLSKSEARNSTAVVILENEESDQRLLVIAAGLLVKGYRVTVACGPRALDGQLLSRMIFQQIPCKNHRAAKELLTFKNVAFEIRQPPCPQKRMKLTGHGAEFFCRIQNAANHMGPLSLAIHDLPETSILLFDESFFAGMLLAEQLSVPAIVILQNHEVLGHTYGVTQHSDQCIITTVRFWCMRVKRAFQERRNSFESSTSFIAYNRIRAQLGLKRARRLQDLWAIGGSLLVSPQSTSSGLQALVCNLLFMPNILPPCIGCLDREVQTQSQAPSIVVSLSFDGSGFERFGARQVAQAFSLAQASLRSFKDIERCQQHDEIHQYSPCWSGPIDFQIIMLERQDNSSGISRQNVFYEETSFLDSLARHRPVAIVTVCDVAFEWTQSLGIPVLCLVEGWSPRQIAFHLLALWRIHVPDLETDKAQDGLSWIVELIGRCRLFSDRNGRTWIDGWDMGRALLTIVRSQDYTKEEDLFQSMSFLLIIAWSVLGLSIVVVTSGHYSSVQSFRSKRLHRYRMVDEYDLDVSAIFDELWYRLPDLKKAWDTWSDWRTERLARWDEIWLSQRRTIADDTMMPRRRRQAHKKRH